jgi:hypothetical protein
VRNYDFLNICSSEVSRVKSEVSGEEVKFQVKFRPCTVEHKSEKSEVLSQKPFPRANLKKRGIKKVYRGFAKKHHFHHFDTV